MGAREGMMEVGGGLELRDGGYTARQSKRSWSLFPRLFVTGMSLRYLGKANSEGFHSTPELLNLSVQ